MLWPKEGQGAWKASAAGRLNRVAVDLLWGRNK